MPCFNLNNIFQHDHEEQNQSACQSINKKIGSRTHNNKKKAPGPIPTIGWALVSREEPQVSPTITCNSRHVPFLERWSDLSQVSLSHQMTIRTSGKQPLLVKSNAATIHYWLIERVSIPDDIANKYALAFPVVLAASHWHESYLTN